ncbi:MAG: riboflavin biosynthesis protein RibD [Maribacter sp.]|nr:MAG: riboflavin biosynthesis protein RibD [Maribacter sp.]
MSIDPIFMERAIQLAQNGLGSTAPNPMVGAVFVQGNRIIGEGYTSAYGGGHAEVNAIDSVPDKSLLSKSTLYVTLEPCSHYGKTPPCADLIIKHKIPNVVIGTVDPHEKVKGEGIARLKESGCKVTVGLLEDACREHHKRFITFHQEQRPFIILKWAETKDGFMAPLASKRNNKVQPYWISNNYSRQLVHKWRSEEQAILVGTNTVMEDDPKLNVREWSGKSPIRIIIDKNLRIQGEYHIFDQEVETIVITEVEDTSLRRKGVDYEQIRFSGNLPEQICQVLYKRNITSVLVEGGAQTLTSFITSGLWDEARIFLGKNTFKEGIKAPHSISGDPHILNIGTDTLNIYRNG